ncbi:conserved hypothetical protein [Alteracholeplasma palmae J233]|uniref:Fido domain-containing protein n=1 Tax=Alteracholeplasma palmae (strain ATCC 49389 / J233) TaxID=1318466 RepID=U4KL35_ALTPJ|nr:hypothetical protein [Alteracholeplasma palmae]CCV64584.1 conserved hypothetical protein [Alteracholeplasma palmae J233]
MKALQNMERIQVNHEVMLLLLSVYESKGKEFYYDELFSRDSNVYEKKVVLDNAYYFAKIFSFDLTDSRLKLLAKKDLLSKNKEEQFYINIREALTLVQKNPKDFELLVNEISDLAKLLSEQTNPIKYQTYKSEEIAILATKKEKSKKEDLEKLIELFNKQIKTKQYELSQLIANFYVDFLNMKIFSDKNQEIALILLYALLIKHFNVFKYVSFFKNFNDFKTIWKSGLDQANYYWETHYAQTDLLSRVLVDILKKSYEEVDEFSREYAFEKNLNKSDNIENTISKGNEVFTKEDIRKAHPTVSEATIDRTLKRLKDENIIRPLGKGRSSKWIRIVESRNKNKDQQLTLF